MRVSREISLGSSLHRASTDALIQWNLRTRDALGATILSLVEKFSESKIWG